ncbi:tetratricopeptide repeat protein [Fodinibius sediminis]|uniref:Tetratricopeptide repeat-containing protein n=1 Tax=Fodinibius sediminis TaxID=1214077 RepID=A0A521DSQ9_9BACT|nr:tetratricopeptide repeat protein [Fodinibius sediminis]SMO74645.1 Tetratricopeptide repeat-containing protein [Fodinibius sediminis]
MLIKKLPHVLLTLLIGVLVGCGSSNPLADKAQSNIESQNFEEALAAAEESIQTNPQDPLGYYYKGVALGEIAGAEEDPEARAETYKEMNAAFTKAQELAAESEDVPGEVERINAVKNVLWQTEHNRAVELATDDSLKQAVNQPLEKSMQHLKNATIIQPDSLLSWNVLSQVAAMNQNFEEAASAKEKYISMVQDTTLEANDYLQLASYNYQLDNQQAVVTALEDAYEQFPENQEIVSNLADAYQRIGEPEKAISTVEKLVEQEPDNPQFHLVLGTQIYQQALTLNDSLSQNSNQILQLQQKLNSSGGAEKQNIQQQITSLEQENAQLQSRIDELTNKAEEELNTVLEYRPNDDAAYNTLGIIYQNKAKAIFDKRNRTTDNAKAAELDKQGRSLLQEAMKNYERAAEIKPNNQGYWKSLFSIYTALGMDEKAQEAMEKAGMQ